MSEIVIDTFCIPKELAQHMLIREIGVLLSAHDELSNMSMSKYDMDETQEVIVESSEIVSFLLGYFPTSADRELIKESVKKRTGHEIDDNFFVGVPTYASEAIRSLLNS